MRYKEFKEKIKDWGEKYNYRPVPWLDVDYIYVMFNSYTETLFAVHKSERFVIDLDWIPYKNLSENEKKELFEIATEFAATKLEEREDKKRFIIPLPNLVTTDGRQQYLSQESQYNHKDCKFFASRRDETLRQIWREEHLKFVPEIYRQFAVEFDEEKEY